MQVTSRSDLLSLRQSVGQRGTIFMQRMTLIPMRRTWTAVSLFLVCAGTCCYSQQKLSELKESTVAVPGSSPQQMVTLAVPARTTGTLVVLIYSALPEETSKAGPDLLARIAHDLGEAGIASLRYTNPPRTPLAGSAVLPTAQVRNAVAALDDASGLQELHSEAEFVLGYGLGGALAPYIADKRHSVRGVILLDPIVLPIEDVLAEQKRREMERQGRPEPVIREQLASQNAILADIRSGKIPAARMFDGAPASYWADWMNRNATEELEKLNLPILALQAGGSPRTSKESYEKLQKTLGAAHAELHWFAELDDSFVQRNRSAGSSTELDPRVAATIVQWIARHCPPRHR